MQRYVAGLPVERAAVEHVAVGPRPAADTETTSAVATEKEPV
jgi:hypothetical protein